LLGFGTVGSAVARRLALEPTATPSHRELTHVFDRRAASKRDAFEAERVRLEPDAAGRPSRIVWTTDVDDVLNSDVDIVVEAIGGVDEALAWTRAALMAGKSVVTGNKQLVASHGPALLELAARQGRQLRYEAAVGGAMPIVRAIGDGLAGDEITRVVAILNGTTNAVLSDMETRGCSLEDALAEARTRGYAEADPSNDLDGIDARAKLSILCALAFGLRVDPQAIATRTCSGIGVRDFGQARRRGATIRQLACASFDRAASELTAWVAPVPVPRRSVFGRTAGAQNAAVVTGAFAGDITITGAGAGGDATAVAVISDILAIARDRAAIVPAPRLSRPSRIHGFTCNAGTSEPVENGLLCDLGELCVDHRLGGLCVDDRLGDLGVVRRIRAEVA
jgi:homoserine dehydrogenase